MLALAYDAALRREELCALRTDDLDPAHRTLRIRAETTKNRLERVVPYSAPTGVLLSDYLAHRARLSRARGPLFLSESRRNHAQPLSLWTWSKVVRRIAPAADVPRFSTHTTRHLCSTDLARMGWDCMRSRPSPGIATRTRRCAIHLSGRDLADKLGRGMDHIHAWRIGMLSTDGPMTITQNSVPAVPPMRITPRMARVMASRIVRAGENGLDLGPRLVNPVGGGGAVEHGERFLQPRSVLGAVSVQVGELGV